MRGLLETDPEAGTEPATAQRGEGENTTPRTHLLWVCAGQERLGLGLDVVLDDPLLARHRVRLQVGRFDEPGVRDRAVIALLQEGRGEAGRVEVNAR